MEIKELRAFVTLAHKLNFTKAATACFTTTSTLSRIIARLEEEVKCSLFYRDNKIVRLTQSGEIFLKFAEQTLDSYMQLQIDLKHLDNPLFGKIRLYCTVTASFQLLPKIINKFRALYPHIEISIETGDAANAMNKIQENEADIAIDAISASLPKDITTITLAEIPLVIITPVVMPQNWYSLKENGKLDWNKVPIIAPKKGELRHSLNTWFEVNNIKPQIYAEVAGNEAIVSMVALGIGVALIPLAVLEASVNKEAIKILEYANNINSLNVSLCVHNKNLKNYAIKAFMDTARNMM